MKAQPMPDGLPEDIDGVGSQIKSDVLLYLKEETSSILIFKFTGTSQPS